MTTPAAAKRNGATVKSKTTKSSKSSSVSKAKRGHGRPPVHPVYSIVLLVVTVACTIAQIMIARKYLNNRPVETSSGILILPNYVRYFCNYFCF